MHKNCSRLVLATSIVLGYESNATIVPPSPEAASDSYTFLESMSKQGSLCFKEAFLTLKESKCVDLSDDQQSRVSTSDDSQKD